MMWVGKTLQAAGLAFLLVSWLLQFPEPPPARLLLIGGGLFLAGWWVLRSQGGGK
mgnify:FL=1